MIETTIKAYERMKEIAAMPEGKIFIRGCGRNAPFIDASEVL